MYKVTFRARLPLYVKFEGRKDESQNGSWLQAGHQGSGEEDEALICRLQKEVEGKNRKIVPSVFRQCLCVYIGLATGLAPYATPWQNGIH